MPTTRKARRTSASAKAKDRKTKALEKKNKTSGAKLTKTNKKPARVHDASKKRKK